MSLSEIEFGKATGEQEGIDYPLLVKEAFVDKDQVFEQIVNGGKFLVLGFKGSGKSSVGEKIRLECYPENPNSDICATVSHLADFPFKSFAKICPGSAEPESKFPTAWQYLLLTSLLDSFSSDPRGRDTENLDFREGLSKLTTAGLLPVKSLKHIAMRSAKQSFKIQLFQLVEFSRESAPKAHDNDMLFMDVVDLLKEMVPEFKTNSRHLLVLDGLDDVLTSRDVQMEALAALIFEVNRLNLWLKREKVRAKIVVLCRTDLFERLPGANKNKIRQDSAIQLDWYHDPREPMKSKLIELANLRAKLHIKSDIDVFDKFFVPTIEGKPTAQFLLEHTRHTPRDFTQLLNKIKVFSEANQRIGRDVALNGIRKYSIEYFLPEIEDELVGYIEHDVFKRFTKAIAKLKQREFKYFTLRDVFNSDEIGGGDGLDDLLDTLFKCSAIGNKWSSGSSNRYEFVYRNPHAELDKGKTIVLHKGLWKSLNLI